jgi:hypothetical protein
VARARVLLPRALLAADIAPDGGVVVADLSQLLRPRANIFLRARGREWVSCGGAALAQMSVSAVRGAATARARIVVCYAGVGALLPRRSRARGLRTRAGAARGTGASGVQHLGEVERETKH